MVCYQSHVLIDLTHSFWNGCCCTVHKRQMMKYEYESSDLKPNNMLFFNIILEATQKFLITFAIPIIQGNPCQKEF